MNIDELIGVYEAKCPMYTQFIASLEMLLKALLKQYNVNVHSVTSRLKDKSSLTTKLSIPDRTYGSLADVHDVCGLRVITYFIDDVDLVSSLIKNEFDVNAKNSVDKRQFLAPDRFGYSSVHYIVKLLPSRLQLTEYRHFDDCVAEIQIRSILQHAWAEIEHDLGYKHDAELPAEIRRRFSRLSGLLELADDEFINIRNQLDEYARRITNAIKDNPSKVKIDQTSLDVYLQSSDLVKNINSDIQPAAHVILLKPNPAMLYVVLKRLRYLRLRTIADVDRELTKNRNLIVHIATHLMEPAGLSKGFYTADICLFYLPYAILSSMGSIDKIRAFCTRYIGKQYDEDFVEFILNPGIYDSQPP